MGLTATPNHARGRVKSLGGEGKKLAGSPEVRVAGFFADVRFADRCHARAGRKERR